ncbi:5689_t:CDS:2, partial [Racocetra persica]
MSDVKQEISDAEQELSNEQEMSDVKQEISNVEQEMNDVKQELSDNGQKLNNQILSYTEGLDLELYSNYELDFQKDSSINTSDDELLTDSNSVSNNNTAIQLPPGFSEALRLLEIKAHSNMTNDMYSEIMDAFSMQNVSLYRATKKLSNGIKCYDGYTNQDFILHCSVVSWSGDMPALAKLMCTTGTILTKVVGQYCNICGIWKNHVYFPTRPPNNKRKSIYDPNNLSKRTHHDYLKKIQRWKAAEKNRNRKKTEITTEFYGRVEYYFVHQFNGNAHMMAFIQWTQKFNEDEYGLKSFREFGIKQFIDVQVIDRCVGFLKYNNILFIIDKKVDDSDDSYIESS